MGPSRGPLAERLAGLSSPKRRRALCHKRKSCRTRHVEEGEEHRTQRRGRQEVATTGLGIPKPDRRTFCKVPLHRGPSLGANSGQRLVYQGVESRSGRSTPACKARCHRQQRTGPGKTHRHMHEHARFLRGRWPSAEPWETLSWGASRRPTPGDLTPSPVPVGGRPCPVTALPRLGPAVGVDWVTPNIRAQHRRSRLHEASRAAAARAKARHACGWRAP